MITVRNEFETVDAFTTLAGCSLGTQTARETTLELIDVADKTSPKIDAAKYYRELASMTDEDTDCMFEMQEEIAQELDYYLPMPVCCSVSLQDNEWLVLPYVDEDLPRVEEIPDNYLEDTILQVNDHGNVTCLEWDHNAREYKSVWAMV